MSKSSGSFAVENQRQYTYVEISKRFTDYIEKEKPGLKRFYRWGTQDEFDQYLGGPVARGLAMTRQLMDKGCPRESSVALSILTLYDLVILIDDSHSMGIGEDDARIKTLSDTLRAASMVYSSAEQAGITAVRFLNNSKKYFNVVPEKINEIMREVVFGGPADIGSKLRDKVLVNHVTPDMKKPLLVIVATNTEIEGEVTSRLRDVIKSQAVELREKYGPYGPQAVAYKFTKIGNDKAARGLALGPTEGQIFGDNIEFMGSGNRLEDIKDDMWDILPNFLLGAISSYWDTEYGISNAVLKNLDDKPTTGSLGDEDSLEEDSDVFILTTRKSDSEGGNKSKRDRGLQNEWSSGSKKYLPSNKTGIRPSTKTQTSTAIWPKIQVNERLPTSDVRRIQSGGESGTDSGSTVSRPRHRASVRTSRNRQTSITIPQSRANDWTPRSPDWSPRSPRSPTDEAWPMHDGIGSMFSKLGMIIRNYRRELVL